MLQIVSVKGENFRSFKKFDFQIKEGLWVVKGANKDDSASDSNGSGKSTLFCDSIIWCLTGNTVNGLDSEDDVVNLKAKKDCFVEVTINNNDHIVKVMRTRKHSQFKNNLLLEVDGQSLSAHRIKDTQDRVNQIIKISPALLKSTIIMAGDISNRFSELTPKDRIALLESVRDYKVWSDFREESKVSLNQYISQIEGLKSSNSNNEGQLTAIASFIDGLSKDYINEKEKTFSEDEILSLEAELNELTSLNDNKEEIGRLTNELHEKNAAIVDVTNKHNKAVGELNSLYTESSNLKYEMQTAQNNIKQYSNLLTTDNVCPTCGQKVVMSEGKKMELLRSLQVTKKSFLEAVEKEKEVASKIAATSISEPEGLQGLRDAITNISLKIQELTFKDNSVKDKIASLNRNIKALKDNITSHSVRLESLVNQINQYKQQALTIKTTIDENNKLLIELDKERSAYQFFYDSLGPKGNLRPYLLRKDVAYLNNVLQYYTARLYSGCSIKLTIPTIDSNKIDIIFENTNGLVKSVSMLSKGERKRLDLCIQFAIYDLVRSTAMFDTNILILDEIFESLDVSGINHVVTMLEERSEVIPSIYVITHNPNAYGLIPRQILISKNNDISKVTFKSGEVDGKTEA